MDQDLQFEKSCKNFCRFCLLEIFDETSQKIVDESTIDHFKNLTGFEVSFSIHQFFLHFTGSIFLLIFFQIQQDAVFQEYSCVSCIEEIKKTSLFKSRMIENLQKLKMILERIKKHDVADTKKIDFNTIDIKEEEFIDNLADQSNK